MADSKTTIVKLILGNDKFEILVKPDHALEYKLGKRTDLSTVLISDEIYSDASKGSRVSAEKLNKYFKTTNSNEIIKQILSKGELNLTTDQRRKMVEEKRKQIIQYINKNYVDPKTKLPHPVQRIENGLENIRVVIDPFKKAEDQIKTVVDSLRKVLPLASEMLQLTITIPKSFASNSINFIKSSGSVVSEQWLSDGSLKVKIDVNAGIRGNFLDRLGSLTKGSAQVKE
ncbi:MAG TPA: ribosome assembly factor SBDS [Candidatus Nitrosocosmicus sp.]|nr:ribosome assembly factor SBDS [Candidatus Nitrosocosmicus sp.]